MFSFLTDPREHLVPRIRNFLAPHVDPRDTRIAELTKELEETITKKDLQITFLLCHADLDLRMSFNKFIMLPENRDKRPADVVQPFLESQMRVSV